MLSRERIKHAYSMCFLHSRYLSSFSLVFSLSMAMSNSRSFQPIANQNLRPRSCLLTDASQKAAKVHVLHLHAVARI